MSGVTRHEDGFFEQKKGAPVYLGCFLKMGLF